MSLLHGRPSPPSNLRRSGRGEQRGFHLAAMTLMAVSNSLNSARTIRSNWQAFSEHGTATWMKSSVSAYADPPIAARARAPTAPIPHRRGLFDNLHNLDSLPWPDTGHANEPFADPNSP